MNRFLHAVATVVRDLFHLWIFLAPILLALGLAVLLRSTAGDGAWVAPAGGVVIAIGLAVGILFAFRVRRYGGAVHFLSRVNASPELDRPFPMGCCPFCGTDLGRPAARQCPDCRAILHTGI